MDLTDKFQPMTEYEREIGGFKHAQGDAYIASADNWTIVTLDATRLAVHVEVGDIDGHIECKHFSLRVQGLTVTEAELLLSDVPLSFTTELMERLGDLGFEEIK